MNMRAHFCLHCSEPLNSTALSKVKLSLCLMQQHTVNTWRCNRPGSVVQVSDFAPRRWLDKLVVRPLASLNWTGKRISVFNSWGMKNQLDVTCSILFHLLCAQHVSDINISIFRSLRLCCWINTSVVLFAVRCVLEFLLRLIFGGVRFAGWSTT